MTFENLIICPQGLRFTRYPRKIFYYHGKLLTRGGHSGCGLRDRARSHRDDRDRAESHRARFSGSARY